MLEYVPGLENEGDFPLGIVHKHVLISRLIDRNTGRILSPHRLETYDEYSDILKWGSTGLRATIDGQNVDISPDLKRHEAEFQNYRKKFDEIQKTLALDGLVESGIGTCIRERNSTVFVVACEAPDYDRSRYQSRLESGVKAVDVRHVLIVMRGIDNAIIHREELGSYYQTEIPWCSDGLLAVELQSHKQWSWSNRCDLRVYDISKD